MWRRVDLVWLVSTGGSVCSHLLTLIPRSRIFLPWRWRWYISLKRRFTQDLHGATFQKPAFISLSLIRPPYHYSAKSTHFSLYHSSQPPVSSSHFLSNTVLSALFTDTLNIHFHLGQVFSHPVVTQASRITKVFTSCPISTGQRKVQLCTLLRVLSYFTVKLGT
jgi:hypothetical protein